MKLLALMNLDSRIRKNKTSIGVRMKWLLCFYCCFMWVILVMIFAYLFNWNKRLKEEEKIYKKAAREKIRPYKEM